MADPDQIEIRRLGPAELPAQLDALADVLADCVAGGASIGFMAPFPRTEARTVVEGMAAEVEQGNRLLLAAFAGDRLSSSRSPRTNRTAARSRSSSSTARRASAASRNS
jgi:hypothetical protein